MVTVFILTKRIDIGDHTQNITPHPSSISNGGATRFFLLEEPLELLREHLQEQLAHHPRHESLRRQAEGEVQKLPGTH